jgi:hypothetical protein
MCISNVEGLGRIEIIELSDVVVFAGPNGVGKTRLMRQLIQFFQNPHSNPNLNIKVEATSEAEFKRWSKRKLDTLLPDDSNLLRMNLQRNQKRNRYESTVLNFDSDRSITQVQPFSFSWDLADPYEEDIGWDVSFRYMRDRFQDVQHSLFKLVENQRRKISEYALKLMNRGEKILTLDYPDPIEPFKTAFSQLLSPKRLLDIDVRQQALKYEIDGQQFPITSLSSGEREVINIAFDFILRNPSDCTIFSTNLNYTCILN